MQNTKQFPILICLMIACFIISCDNTDIPIHQTRDGQIFETRTDDCEDCPLNDCCCGIQWLSGSMGLSVQFCGTSGSRLSTETCEADPPSPCSQITGYLFGPVSLNFGTPKQGFCMNPGDSFVIYVSGIGTPSFRITCQDDVGMPQSVTVNLTGGFRYYFDTNGSCEVAPCT